MALMMAMAVVTLGVTSDSIPGGFHAACGAALRRVQIRARRRGSRGCSAVPDWDGMNRLQGAAVVDPRFLEVDGDMYTEGPIGVERVDATCSGSIGSMRGRTSWRSQAIDPLDWTDGEPVRVSISGTCRTCRGWPQAASGG